jgi:hypothetical protein
MGAEDVFPAEMPDDPTSPIGPLDDDTAERLLAGRLDPLDAPPPYAAVARLLQAAAAPPTPDELAGEPAALAAFRSLQARPRPAPGRRSRPGGGGRSRRRLVAVALVGTLLVGGLLTAQGAALLPGLRSPTGGAAAGGSGSGASRLGGTGSGGSGAQGVGPGALRVVRPQTGGVPARRPSAPPSAHDRVTKPAKPKPAKPKPAKPKPSEAKAKAGKGAKRK